MNTIIIGYLITVLIERGLLIARSNPQLTDMAEEMIRLEATKRVGRAKYGDGILVEQKNTFAHLGNNRWNIEYVPTGDVVKLEQFPIIEYTTSALQYNLKGLSFKAIIKRLEREDCTAIASLVQMPIDILKVFPIPFAYRKFWRICIIDDNDDDLNGLAEDMRDIQEKLPGFDVDTASTVLKKAITIEKRETDL